MKSTKSYLVTAFIIAFSVLLIIPLWAVYGVLLPEEGGHGGGEMVMAMEFQQKTMAYKEEHELPDGTIEADHDGPVYIMISQYAFTPNTIRLKTGERYTLQILSIDVVHGFTIVMGDTSYNTVVLPMMVTEIEIAPDKPGTYLVICSEYCGLGHDYMYSTFIVEQGTEHEHEDEEDEHEEEGEEH